MFDTKKKQMMRFTDYGDFLRPLGSLATDIYLKPITDESPEVDRIKRSLYDRLAGQVTEFCIVFHFFIIIPL